MSQSKSKPQNRNAKGKFNQSKDRMTDASNQDSFIFNKTPILASALKKLKAKGASSLPKVAKRSQPINIEDQQHKTTNKKVKRSAQDIAPSLSYTPLQRDLYNFFTINKTALKGFESVPEPKFEVGSTILTALCDRGIGGKFLVGNLFRNKKCYIDYKQVNLIKTSDSKCLQTLEKYDEPGTFLVGTVVKGRSQAQVQISLSSFLTIDQKHIRLGQTFPAQIKSKQQLGCHLIVYGLQKFKVFLPKVELQSQQYEQLVEDRQVIVSVKTVQQSKKIIKVTLAAEDPISMNFKGLDQQDLPKMQLDQYVSPGTILTTKIIKVLSNGIMVKFLKIFIGFVHFDHLKKDLDSYTVGEKLQARVLFYCINPPTLYLSQKHLDLSPYQPQRQLFSQVSKPERLTQRQKAFFNRQQQFYAHPGQLHTDMKALNKFWVKQNNYFEKYQIMSSKKVGVLVGEISKYIPFSNFKLYGQKEGQQQGHKFRVMCLDVWNKVIKISYDPKILKAPSDSLLKDVDNINTDNKYIGFIMSVNPNGVVIEFCNNIKGIISKNELKLGGIQITEANIGEGFDVYVCRVKKGYIGLTLKPPAMRISSNKGKAERQGKKEFVQNDGESVQMGTIQSVNMKSIAPIYIKLQNRVAKISVFDGIRPPSIADSHIIENLTDNYKVGQNVKVFRKGKQFFLYPPEQMKDKQLRYCRIIGVKGSSLRVQTGQNEFKNCHITNVTDIVTPYPLNEYKAGDYTIGRLIDDRQICLRKSIVQHGIPKNMQQCIKRSKEAQLNGDLRNRILTMGSVGLKNQMICFGYVKTFGEKGCFVSLSHNYEVRVDKSELSDSFNKNLEKQFKTNKIVLLRLINSKVKNNEPNKIMFDASLRESVVKHGFPITDDILENGVGLTVEGTVKGYTKGKALIQLNASKFTGIIGLNDIEGVKEDQSIEKALPIGKMLKMKVCEYSLKDGKRLIRLSTLNKYFNKFKQFNAEFPAEERVIKLWDNFKNLEAIEMPEVEKEILIAQQIQDEDDEQARLVKLFGGAEKSPEQSQYKHFQEQQDQEMQMDEEQNENEDSSNDNNNEIDQENPEEEENDDDDEEEDNDQALENIEQKKLEHQQYRKRTALFEKMPHDSSFYHSLVLANPTPESWLMYISSLVNTSSAAQIRVQFLKAIHSFSSIQDKDNMWISWMNMELILGDLEGTVKKAVENNVGMTVYFRILEILAEKEQWQIAIEFGRKMLKKFNKQMKAYIQFLKMVTQYNLSGQPFNESIAPKQIIRRASQCLKSHEVITIQSHMARNMFEINQAQNGRSIFEELISKHPKRTDLWAMYVDMEVKANQLNKARNLLERELSLSLAKKQVKAILKKYYLIEQEHGSKKSADAILERAKQIAGQFQNNNMDEEQMDQQ